MKQKGWVKLIKDYDYVFQYHLGKENMMANALNQKNTMKGDKEIILGRKELLEVLRGICAHLTLGFEGTW